MISDKWFKKPSKKELYDLVEEQGKEIKRLSKEVDMWNKKYNEQFDIINELEKWLEEQKIRNSEWNNFVGKDGRLGIPVSYLLNKLQELKGDSSNDKQN